MIYNEKSYIMEVSEILEPVHATVKEILDRDSRGSADTEYTDSDVIAVALLYASVCSKRLVQTLKDEKVSLGYSQQIATNYGNMIQEITLGMTGVDVGNYYKGGSKK